MKKAKKKAADQELFLLPPSLFGDARPLEPDEYPVRNAAGPDDDDPDDDDGIDNGCGRDVVNSVGIVTAGGGSILPAGEDDDEDDYYGQAGVDVYNEAGEKMFLTPPVMTFTDRAPRRRR